MNKYKLISLFILIGLLTTSDTRSQTKLSVHGFLTQAYAKSYNHPIFGISTLGTFDYRYLAMQFRYDMDAGHNIAIQLNHRRIGTSPLNTIEDDVSLDWAFFRYQINEHTSVKFGKILLPFGIYNEIRDVGILLPFYRAPYSAYGDENYISETVDGILFSHVMRAFSPWEFEVNVYGGEWKWAEWHLIENPFTNVTTQIVGIVNVRNSVGTQLTVQTAVNGWIVGCGAHHGRLEGGLSFSDEIEYGLGEQSYYLINFFDDFSLNRLFIRSEFNRYYLSETKLNVFTYYSQLGFNVKNKFLLNFQADFFKIRGLPVPEPEIEGAGTDVVNIDFYRDYAVSLNYEVNSNVIFKIEYHWNWSFVLEDGAGDMYRNIPANMRYIVLSVSTSF